MLIAGMQPFIVYSGAALALIVRAFLFTRGLRRQLWNLYPCFFAMAIVSAMRSTSTLADHPFTYRQYWFETQWPLVLLQAATVIEAFWILADHFRGIRNFAWRLLGIILAISAVTAAVVVLMKTQFGSPIRGALLVDQYVSLWFVLTALFSTLFFRQFSGIPIRPNAIRHMRILSLLFGLNFLGNTMLIVSHNTWRVASLLTFAVNGVASYAWWTIVMDRTGEKLPFRVPEMSDSDYAVAEAVHKRSAQLITHAGSDGLKKSLGS